MVFVQGVDFTSFKCFILFQFDLNHAFLWLVNNAIYSLKEIYIYESYLFLNCLKMEAVEVDCEVKKFMEDAFKSQINQNCSHHVFSSSQEFCNEENINDCLIYLNQVCLHANIIFKYIGLYYVGDSLFADYKNFFL